MIRSFFQLIAPNPRFNIKSCLLAGASKRAGRDLLMLPLNLYEVLLRRLGSEYMYIHVLVLM